MCRLFGFRSAMPSQVHSSLVAADNALGVQSKKHPDGWGIAYYVDDVPHVIKSPSAAGDDQLFQHLGSRVASQTVLAHIRKATVGKVGVLNSHPFQFGRWVFAHNGTIADFEEVRTPLLEFVSPKLRRFILGETDSETVFFMFLSELERHGPLSGVLGIDEILASLSATVKRIRVVADQRRPGKPPSSLTFLTTNGSALVASRAGRELFWSTYKTSCASKNECQGYGPECEAPTQTGIVKHLLVSSEPLGEEGVWNELPEGHTIAVDWRMKLVSRKLEMPASPVPVLSTADLFPAGVSAKKTSDG